MASRAGRSWAPAVAGALAVHAAMVLAVVLTVEIASPPKPPPPMIVQLLRAPIPAAIPRPRPIRSAAPRPAALAVAASPASPTMPTGPSTVAGPAKGTPAPMEIQAPIRGLLRGSVGCADARFYRLSPEEEAKCHRFLQAHIDPDLQIPAPIDPLKRSWYDATVRARQVASVMQPGHSRPSLIAGKCGGGGGGTGDVKAGPCTVRLSTLFDDDDAPLPGR